MCCPSYIWGQQMGVQRQDDSDNVQMDDEAEDQ